MSHKRYANRRDANETEIVAALRAIGCSVGFGDWVDLIVGYRGQTYLLEVKDGSKPKSGRKLKPSQEKLLAQWYGHYEVVLGVDDAMVAVGAKQRVINDHLNPRGVITMVSP